MGAVIEVKYFNSYWIKKTNAKPFDNDANDGKSPTYMPNWTGLPFKQNLNFSNNPSLQYVNFYTVGAAPKPAIDNSSNVASLNWFIEEARIRGGFNENFSDYGVKAYLENKNFIAKICKNQIIYSGIFNSDTNVNETNVFSEATRIYYIAPPEYGSIQKLYSSDTKLHIFQENKVSRALIDKDAIYSASGQGTPVSTTKLVIGEITPYVGEYGISTNPESWAQFGNRQYFSDKNRNTVLRLAENGLTEIAAYGMTDFFRDELSLINSNIQFDDSVDQVDGIVPSWPYPISISSQEPYLFRNSTGGGAAFFQEVQPGDSIIINGVETGCYVDRVGVVGGDNVVYISSLIPFEFSAGSSIVFRRTFKDSIIGCYDVYADTYTISLQKGDEEEYKTLSFDEKSLGWVSFYDYKPSFMVSLFNNFYSSNESKVYLHYVSDDPNSTFFAPRNSFYGNPTVPSSIEFIFNDQPTVVKNFKTLNYEGSSGWEVESMISDPTGSLLGEGAGTWQSYNDSIQKIRSYYEGKYIQNGVTKRAGFYIKENRYCANIINNSVAIPGEIVFGRSVTGIKGYYTTVKFKTDETTDPGRMKELFAVGTEYVPSSY